MLGKFHIETTGVDRCFCLHCGTRLYNHVLSKQRLALVVETLQNDKGIQPIAHCNTESKASWYAISDELPQFSKAPSPTEIESLLAT